MDSLSSLTSRWTTPSACSHPTAASSSPQTRRTQPMPTRDHRSGEATMEKSSPPGRKGSARM